MPTDADLQAMSTMIKAALQESTSALTKFAEKAKESAGAAGGFKQMESVLGSIAKNLAGPVGLTALFVGAGKAVSEFADTRLKLSLFSKDVGLSTDTIYGLRRAMFLAGKESAEADRAIGAFGGTMKDLQANRYGSKIFQDLMQLGPGVSEIAKQLVTIADTGDFDKALRLMETKWGDWGPRTRIKIAEAFHMTESDMEAGFERLHHHIDKASQEAAEATAKRIREYRLMFADAWEYALEGAVDAIDRNRKAFKDARWLTPSEISDLMFKGQMPGDKATQPQAGEAGESWWQRMMTPRIVGDQPKPYPAGGDPMGGDYTRPESMVGKVQGWLGRRSDAGTSGSTDFSSRGRADDLIQVETDSSKTLRDIRDSLQRMETGVGETRSSNVGGGRRGLARRLGIDRQGGGGGGDGSGGDSGTQFEGDGGGGGNTLRGKVGGGGSVLGGRADVADVANLAGNESLEKQRASRMAEINNDPELKENTLKMLALEESKGVPRTAAMEALLNRSVMTKNSIKQELFSGFYGPINRGGLSRELGAGSRATSQAALDAAGRGSNLIQGRTDQGAIGDPNASGPGRLKVPGTSGIYNYWQGKRGGHFYSHEESAAFAEQQNRLAERLPQTRARGMDDSGTQFGDDDVHARGMADSGTQFGGGDDVHARDMVDSTKSAGGDASMSASIDFKNMPSWVRTAVDDNGKFKTLKVSRSTPQNGRAGSGLGDFSPWAYE